MTVMNSTIRTSAPGSIMVTGEHAVVYGHKAVVSAIEQRISITLTPRSDRSVRITSEIAAPLELSLEALPEGGDYRFVLAAIAHHLADLPSGFTLEIRSEIDPTLGLGSSAAVTVACLGALTRFAGKGQQGLHADALAIVRKLQGRGSGADLAASFHGGLIAYRPPQAAGNGVIQALPLPPVAVSLKYCGYKTPTSEVLRMIAEKMAGDEARFNTLYDRMGAESAQTIAAAECKNWDGFYQGLNRYQTLMEDLGVCDETLGEIITSARSESSTLAAKISGSGLGDCVLALGTPPTGFVPVTLAKKGLTIDA